MSAVQTMSIEEGGAHYYGLGRAGSYLAAKRGDLILVGRGKHKRVSVPAMDKMMLEAKAEPRQEQPQD